VLGSIVSPWLFKNPKIEVIWDHVIDEILGENDPLGVTGVRLAHSETGAKRAIAVDGVFVAIGHAPSSELVQGQLELHHGGYVVPLILPWDLAQYPAERDR
jgi:thioredoxin reductase (NADPH)